MAVRASEGVSSPGRKARRRPHRLGALAGTLGVLVALGCTGSDDIDQVTFGGPDGGDGQAGMGGTHGGFGGSGVAGVGPGGSGAGGFGGAPPGGQGGTAGNAGAGGQGGSLGGAAGAAGTSAGGTSGAPGDAGVEDASSPPADAALPPDAGSDAPPPADAAPDVVCTGDFDADGFCDELDNCPHLFNDDQADFDGDGVGYACDSWVELPQELWDPADTTWRFSLSSKNGVHVVAGAPRKAGGGAAGAVVFESGAYFTTYVSSVGSNEAIGTFLGADGVGWVGFGTQETIRVLDGVVSSPYGYASLFNSPDGGVFAWSGGNVDVWDGTSEASVIVAQSLSPLSFNQVTYFIVDEGSGPALRVYDSTGQISELVPATQTITSVGGIGGQVFCYTDGATAHLAMYDSGSLVAGWPLTIAGGSCTDAAQISVRVGDLQRSNEPSGAVWYRTFDDGASQYVYHRAAAPKDPPTVMGVSAGKTNAALMPGADLYLLTETAGGASELLYLNAGSLQSIRSWSVPVGTEARGGADPLWTYWIDPVPGTAVNPSVVSVERVVAGAISGPFALPTDGYDGHAVTWTDVAPSGELWLDVLHGGPTAPTYDLFVVDGLSATKVAPSGGASVTATWAASGDSLVGTDAGIYRVQGTTATLAAASIGPHQLVLRPPYGDGTDGSGWWWVTFETAPGVWSVARWQDTTFDVMLTGQSAAATGSYDSGGDAYMVSGDSTFALSHLAGGAITPLLGGLEMSPLVVNRGSTLWVAHTVGGVTRLSPVSGGSAGSAVLYADGGIVPFGSVYDVGVLGPSGTVENALCAFDVAGPTCTDAGSGAVVSRASAGPDAGGTRTVVATSDAAGAAYLWRNVETLVPPDCCAPSATEGSCSSASVASCVCAADETCCTGSWSSACVALVSSAGCGSCVP